MKVIDLSKEITEDRIVPGENDGYSDPKTQFKSMPWVTFDIKNYYVTKISMGAHTGTHCDAPKHVKENGRSVSDYDVNNWVGYAIKIDLNSIDLSDEEKFEQDYRHLIKGKDDKILILSGSSDLSVPSNIRSLIIEWKPKAIVFGDCVNVEGIIDTMEYLGNDIPMVMDMDTSKLSEIDDGDIIVALPIKFIGIEASPVRLVAIKM